MFTKLREIFLVNFLSYFTLSPYSLSKSMSFLISGKDYFVYKEKQTTPVPGNKCSLEKNCPPDSFAVRIKSGAANVVGPTICFDGQNVMSHVMNNVGPGFNIVVVNRETGTVDKFGYLNSKSGRSEDIINYLKKIEPGRIVLLATFDDVTPKLTDEIRDVLESMGSTLIKTVKSKDNWVFAGTPGAAEKSPFEKMTVNDLEKNMYKDWPEVVEISGCFPKNS
uniref:Si:dkeyp-67f1.2 n=1 Tax=Neogobius melanostomus TaxID=47308 RepID=A0A8C6V6B7_9GOBI